MVLIEGDPSAAEEPRGSAQVVAAQVEELGPNAVRVTARVDKPSYVVLDDFYQRGWTARIDGQPARVLIVNALFRGVSVEAGAHEIEFRFEPQSLLIGAIISAISLLGVLAALAIGYAQSRR
jgi:uncharacterized membrane protein YfhO